VNLRSWSYFRLQPAGDFFCLFENSKTSVLVYIFLFGFMPPLVLAGYYYSQVMVALRLSSTVHRDSWSNSQKYHAAVAKKMLLLYLFLLASWTPAMV